jgi:hypothetical protein
MALERGKGPYGRSCVFVRKRRETYKRECNVMAMLKEWREDYRKVRCIGQFKGGKQLCFRVKKYYGARR